MRKYKLRKLLTIKNGCDYRHLSTGAIPVYGSGGLMCFVNKAISNKPSILLPRKGTLDNIMFVDEPFWTVDTMYWTEVKKDIVEPYYLYNYLKVLKFDGIRSGSTLPSMTSSAYYDIPIVLPDYNEQKKIAAILKILDVKIALNNRINQELEQMAKTLYDYWFVQFDFPDEKGRPYKSANGKMVYNEVLKREIPEGWEVKNIFDVLDIQYGYPFNTELFTDNGGYSVVRIRDILTNSISAHTLEKVDDKYKLHEGDLLIGMDGNFHMNYWNETGAYLNQRCVRIRCKEEQALSIIQAKYSLEPFIKKREQNISRTTVGHLSDKDFKSQYILVPKVNPNFHPKETFESILYRITNNNNEIKNLVVLRDFLLPLLMNGQVIVQN